MLDLETGKARYFTLPDRLFEGIPLWSPDGSMIAIRAGDLVTGDWRDATVGLGAVYLLDLASGSLRAITEPDREDFATTPEAWSPDSKSLLLLRREENSSDAEHLIVDAGGGPAVRLTGPAIWVTGERLVVHEWPGPQERRLLLVDRSGQELRTLATGRDIGFLLLSPDRRHLTFAQDPKTGRWLPSDPPSKYLTVIRVE